MKSKPKTTSLSRSVAVITAALALAGGIANVRAADKTWDGGGDGVNWSASPANWVGDTAPVASDNLYFDGSVGLAPNNDFAVATIFNNITFNGGAGAFVMTGNEINLAGGVTNLSPNLQTLSMNLNQTGGRIFNCATGAIVLNGIIKNNFATKEGTNFLQFGGGTANSGNYVVVNQGTVILAKTSGNALGSSQANTPSTTVNTNGTLRIAGPGNDQIHFNQRIIMNGGVMQVQTTNTLGVGQSEEIASLSGSNVNSVVENGLAGTTTTLTLGGGSGHRGIYSGRIRDGAAGVLNIQAYRANQYYAFKGTNTYTGTTAINNTAGTGYARLIEDGVHTGGGAYTINGHSSTVDRLAALGGSGIISASVVNFNIRGYLSPGGTLSADLSDAATFTDTTGILTFSNAVNLTHATATLDVQLNGTTPGSGYDQVNIAGSGSFSNNAANLKLTLVTTPANGDKFTLVKVQGTDPANNIGTFATLNGVVADLSQGATNTEPSSGKLFRISYRAEGSTFDMGAGNGNDIMIEFVAPPVAGKNVAWRGDGVNNFWDTTTANWFTNGLPLTTFANGDGVTFDNFGSNNVPVNIVSSVAPASILVDSTNIYQLDGAGLTNAVLITKTNTGTLIVNADNANTGSTQVRQGVLQIGTNGITGSLSSLSSMNIAANGTVVHRRSDDAGLTVAFSGTGAFIHDGTGKLLVTNAVPFTGRVSNTGGLLQLGDGTSADGSFAGDINVSSNANVQYLSKTASVLINNTLSGSGTVNYDAPAYNARTYTTTTSLVNSNFAGTNIVGANICLHAADINSGYALGNGGVVIATTGDSQVWLDRSTTPYNQAFFLSGNGGTTYPFGAMRIFGCTVSGPVTLLGDTRFGGSISSGTIIGPISGGSFTLEVNGGANSFVLGVSNSANAWGNTLVTSGGIRALGPNSISTNAMTIDINGELNTFGNTVAVNSLVDGSGGAGAVYNKSTAAAGTVVIGGDGSSSSFSGTFGDGASSALNVTKVGAGTLTLSATSTNTGTLAVNGGTLALTGTGSFGNATAIAVGTGATLDVSGRGDGTLTLNASQTLKHSGSSVGPIALTGNLTVGSGAVLLALNRTNAPATNDSVAVSGTFTAGGTLTVTNLGPVLAAGNSFQLFPGAVSGFGTVYLQTVDAANNVQYTWSNTLGSDGKITVASVVPLVNTNAPALQVSVSGSTLSLAWPTNAGWTLLTNSVSLTATNQWFSYPNSANLTNVNITIDPAKTNVFFKMQYPYP